MPYITITRGLTIKVPTKGTTNWDETMRTDTFNKISEHDHTGSGNGVQLSTSSIAADSITGAKIRLDNNEALRARNAANSANVNLLKLDTNNELILQTTVGSANFQDDGLTILDNADNTKIIAFNASGITTGTTRTLSAPDATGTIVLNDNTATLTGKTIDADLNTLSNIENADIKAAAAIALDKLAATTASRALVSDGSGFVTAATTTATEIGYVNGVTSAIQTQINTKAPSASPTFTGTVTTPVTASRALVTGASSELSASATTATELGYVSGVTSAIQTQINTKLPTTITTTGDIIYSSSGTTASRLGIGTAGQVLIVSGGLPAWGTNSVAPLATVTKSTTYTATTNEDTILVDTSGGAWTLTLYTAASNSGRRLTIIKTTSDLNALTVDGDGSETINGSATTTVDTQYEKLSLVSNGSNWLIENRCSDTKPVSYTPTMGAGLGTVTSSAAFWHREGKYMYVRGSFVTGTVTTAVAGITLPTGYSVDTAFLNRNNTTSAVGDVVGDWSADTASQWGNILTAPATSASTVYISVGQGGTSPNIPTTSCSTNAISNNNDPVGYYFEVPISGWKGENE